MIMRRIFAVVAMVSLAAAAAAHLLNDESVAEIIGYAAFASLALAAVVPGRQPERTGVR